MPLPSVPAVPVWYPGTIGAAQFNTNLRDPFNFLLNKPRFRARLTASGSPTKGAHTYVPWDTADEDPYGGWTSGDKTKYTVQQYGWYAVSATVSLTGTAAVNTVLIPACAVNGNSQTGFGAVGWEGVEVFIPTGAPITASSFWEVYCLAGDVIQIDCFYSSEPAANLSWNTATGQQPHVEICWMGI